VRKGGVSLEIQRNLRLHFNRLSIQVIKLQTVTRHRPATLNACAEIVNSVREFSHRFADLGTGSHIVVIPSTE
jgi:hypothetical protein